MEETIITKEILSREEAAKYIGIHFNTLDKINIPRIRIGRRVLFRRQVIDSFLADMERSDLNKRGPKCRK